MVRFDSFPGEEFDSFPGEENTRRCRDTSTIEQLKFGFKIHVQLNEIEDEIDC